MKHILLLSLVSSTFFVWGQVPPRLQIDDTESIHWNRLVVDTVSSIVNSEEFYGVNHLSVGNFGNLVVLPEENAYIEAVQSVTRQYLYNGLVILKTSIETGETIWIQRFINFGFTDREYVSSIKLLDDNKVEVMTGYEPSDFPVSFGGATYIKRRVLDVMTGEVLSEILYDDSTAYLTYLGLSNRPIWTYQDTVYQMAITRDSLVSGDVIKFGIDGGGLQHEQMLLFEQNLDYHLYLVSYSLNHTQDRLVVKRHQSLKDDNHVFIENEIDSLYAEYEYYLDVYNLGLEKLHTIDISEYTPYYWDFGYVTDDNSIIVMTRDSATLVTYPPTAFINFSYDGDHIETITFPNHTYTSIVANSISDGSKMMICGHRIIDDSMGVFDIYLSDGDGNITLAKSIHLTENRTIFQFPFKEMGDNLYLGQGFWKTQHPTQSMSSLHAAYRYALDLSDIVSIEDNLITSAQDYYLYPNPATDAIYIASDANYIGKRYTIHNILGGITAQGVLDSDAIAIGELTRGSYYVHIFDDSSVWSGKFVKQ